MPLTHISAKLDEPFTFNAENALAFRLYPDNRPRNLEIANLQKGLILLLNFTELVEEGAGFGVPIAKYSDTTFFCSTARVHLHRLSSGNVVLTKTFFLDAVSRKQIRGAKINSGLYLLFHKAFEMAYLSRQSLRPVFDSMMHLRQTLGIQTQFEKVSPRGFVTVTYHCLPSQIKVHVDFSALEKVNCQELLLLNEQGASYFRNYSDTNGTILHDREVGAMTKVMAKQASFLSLDTGISFLLETVEPAVMYRGREQIKGRFSWSGLTYQLNPNTAEFGYTIKLSRRK